MGGGRYVPIHKQGDACPHGVPALVEGGNLVSRTLRHAMVSLYPDFTQTKPGWSCRFTQFAPPEGALLHTKGFCGASGEATARAVNLYADMGAAFGGLRR